MKERILVTGGTGYIGSHTVVELQNSGYEVIIIDNLSNSNADVVDNIEKVSGIRPAFEKLDCLDFAGLDAIFTKYKGIKAIIHFAASKAVGESVEKPLLYYRNNLVSLINLLELMPKHGVEGIVFSSSCTVYGQPDELPVTEKAPIKKAESPYGNTKQINEEIIRDTVASGAPINAIMLRYFNPIGAHPTALLGELPNGVPQNLIPYLTQTAIGIREKLSVFGDDYDTPDGSCIRDFINVVDLAKAHVIAIRRILEQKQKEKAVSYSSLPLPSGRGLFSAPGIEWSERRDRFDQNRCFAGRRPAAELPCPAAAGVRLRRAHLRRARLPGYRPHAPRLRPGRGAAHPADARPARAGPHPRRPGRSAARAHAGRGRARCARLRRTAGRGCARPAGPQPALVRLRPRRDPCP